MTTLCVQWNIRSFRANGHWLRIAPFSAAKILCLQETFLKPSDNCSMPNMTVYREDRLSSRGGGVLTSVHSTWPSYRFPLPRCPDPSVEVLGVAVYFDCTWHLILNAYSPAGSFPDEWLSSIISAWEHQVLIFGDFNINLLPGRSPPSSQLVGLLDWITTEDLCLLNWDIPTRAGAANHESLLDLTILSPTVYNKIKFYVHPDLFDSDHFPIVTLFSVPAQNPAIQVRPNWKAAAQSLNSTTLPSSSTYSEFINLCSRSLAQSSAKVKPSSRPACPWWNASCQNLLRIKRRQLRIARVSCSRSDWLLYKKFSAQLRRQVKSAARRFWDLQCSRSCSGSQFYKLLNRLVNNQAPQGDNIIQDPQLLIQISDQAQAFLHHFSSEGCDRPIPVDLSSGDPDLDAAFTIEELNSAIQKTRPTSPGADGISAKLIKRLSPDLRAALLQIYNHIFESGIIPQAWKEAQVIPIRKPGKPAHLVSSYRPIALTPVLCKIFERMLLRRLLAWGGRNRMFHPEHFGFLPTRDCTSALGTFLNDVLLARKSNYFIAAICLDIMAAYDSVCPDILVQKLASLGIGGKTGYWLSSFVHSRHLQIRWKHFLSSFACWFRGVPQGSVLSPLLFLIYMLGISDTLEEGVYIIIYADDIFVYVIHPDEARGRQKLRDTLARIQLWCSANELAISPSKCSAINFSRRRDPGPSFWLDGVEIPWSSSVKILGVWLSRNLCFGPHFTKRKIHLNKRLNQLKAISSRSRGITSYHMIKIVNSLIRSSLEYGAPLFYDSPPSSIRILEVCYNAAIRLATGLPRWTPLPVLRREAGVSTISSRLNYLTKRFLLRILSAPSGLRLGDVNPSGSFLEVVQAVTRSCSYYRVSSLQYSSVLLATHPGLPKVLCVLSGLGVSVHRPSLFGDPSGMGFVGFFSLSLLIVCNGCFKR